eukprot:RCo046057
MAETEFVPELFAEPEGFFEAEAPPTTTAYTLKDGRILTLEMVGSHPLYGHLLTGASRVLANKLDGLDLHGKRCLELGAGCGLPSLVAACSGAEMVVVTDYPEVELLESLRRTVHRNRTVLPDPNSVIVEGHLWGKATDVLKAKVRGEAFDLIVCSDLLFNHHCHRELLRSCHECLAPDGKVLVAFSPHNPGKLPQDRNFFAQAQAEPFHFAIAEEEHSKVPALFIPRGTALSPSEFPEIDLFFTVLQHSANHPPLPGSALSKSDIGTGTGMEQE